jgi:hypothetical protein
MKAEHRHQLHQNALREALKGGWRKLKEGSGSSLYTYLGVAALLVVLLIGYRWYAARSFRKESDRWVKWTTANDIDALKKLEQENRGTLVGRLAALQIARVMIGPDGLDRMATSVDERRKQAVANIVDARERFHNLANEFKDQPPLRVQALWGEAQSEEALVGVPKEDNPLESRGNIDTAIKLYKELAAAFPGTETGKLAEKKATELLDKRDEVIKFYNDLHTSLARADVTPPTSPFPPPLSPTTPITPVTPPIPPPDPIPTPDTKGPIIPVIPPTDKDKGKDKEPSKDAPKAEAKGKDAAAPKAESKDKDKEAAPPPKEKAKDAK